MVQTGVAGSAPRRARKSLPRLSALGGRERGRCGMRTPGVSALSITAHIWDSHRVVLQTEAMRSLALGEKLPACAPRR